jgi:hypothetical protein
LKACKEKLGKIENQNRAEKTVVLFRGIKIYPDFRVGARENVGKVGGLNRKNQNFHFFEAL